MTCSVHRAVLPRSQGVKVNGVAIARDLIAREVQHHPARTPAESLKAAAQALVVRELLLQEARRLDVEAEPLVDADGRRETAEEAAVRALVELEVCAPRADDTTCRRYYEQNRTRFRSKDIYEAAHILFAVHPDDDKARNRVRADAEAALAELRENPEKFSELARAHSACPSAQQGGNLGQVTEGQTTPEFEQALFALEPGSVGPELVETRYGFHVLRLDRRIAGRDLPFELVAGRIAEYLHERVRRQALAQYVARLATTAHIEGIELPTAESMRVN